MRSLDSTGLLISGKRSGPVSARTLVFAACVLTAFSVASGQDKESFMPADTSSPRATLESFIGSINKFYELTKSEKFLDRSSPELRPFAVRILDCLDVSEIPEYEKVELAGEAAVCLKEILDRFELPALEEVPDLSSTQASSEPLARWQIPGTRLIIARVDEGSQKHEFLFSPGSVARAVEYYNDVKSLPYRSTGPATSPGLYDWYITAPGHPLVGKIVYSLPDWFRERSLEIAHWKWVGLTIASLLAILALGIIYRAHFRLHDRYRNTSLVCYCMTILLPLAAVGVTLAYKQAIYDYLTMRARPLYVASFIANVATLVTTLVVVFGTVNRISAVIISSPRINPRGLDAQFVRIVSKISSVSLAIIILLEGGQYLGIPVTTLIASAGVTGLAVALAAQDMLKNLFGTVMLLTDKPFRVGERIVLGNYDGHVEEIGLRSTRLRLLTGHQVTIPNDELARNDIENVGRRPYIRRDTNINIPLDTPRHKLEQAVTIIRSVLDNHEGMDSTRPPRVHFVDFAHDAFTIKVMYWYSPPEYYDFLAMSEKINFEIFRQFEEHGIQFTLPHRLTTSAHGDKDLPQELKDTGKLEPTR